MIRFHALHVQVNALQKKLVYREKELKHLLLQSQRNHRSDFWQFQQDHHHAMHQKQLQIDGFRREMDDLLLQLESIPKNP